MAPNAFNVVWPVLWADEFSSLDPDVKLKSEAFAIETLRMLTLYRVGLLSATVMPQSLSCNSPLHSVNTTMDPIIADSQTLKNCNCIFGCSCGSDARVYLKGPIHSINEVIVRGEVLEPSVYGVLDDMWLVRTDGGTFPTCAGLDFTVTYTFGTEVGILGQVAAGALAGEFARLFTTPNKCRLPRSVTNITRQGVTLTLDKAMFENGMTGIQEPDIFIRQWNPHGLITRPTVWSPDLEEPHTLVRY